LSFYIQFGFCQSIPDLSDKPEKLINTKYNLETRLNFYPYNQSVQVKIVSFDAQVDTGKSFPEQRFIYKLPITNDTICFSKLDGIVSLNPQQIDSLTDILYNTCFRWTIVQTSKSGCYLPHNAIIFFDNNNKPFEYIEICFDCRLLQYSSDKIVKFEDCDFALKDLREYFKILGLKTSISDFKK
jgi:hypothetical protein